MQGVVETLGHSEEVVAAGDDIPANREAQLLEQRDDAVEYLGHAAADGSRVDHLDGAAGQALPERADFGHLGFAHHGNVVIKPDEFRRGGCCDAHEAISWSINAISFFCID